MLNSDPDLDRDSDSGSNPHSDSDSNRDSNPDDDPVSDRDSGDRVVDRSDGNDRNGTRRDQNADIFLETSLSTQ